MPNPGKTNNPPKDHPATIRLQRVAPGHLAVVTATGRWDLPPGEVVEVPWEVWEIIQTAGQAETVAVVPNPE